MKNNLDNTPEALANLGNTNEKEKLYEKMMNSFQQNVQIVKMILNQIVP